MGQFQAGQTPGKTEAAQCSTQSVCIVVQLCRSGEVIMKITGGHCSGQE